ncbi:phosphate-regulating neutral endopeptidase PHEX-like [Ciona intestinalis]
MLLSKVTLWLLFICVICSYVVALDQEGENEYDSEYEDEEIDEYRPNVETAEDSASDLKFSEEVLVNLRQLLRDQASSNLELVEPKTSCSVLTNPAHSTTNCGTVSTSLGPVVWCKITCNHGYKLKEATPQYELCGKPTKYRWTYQLRGLTRPQERCVVGVSTFNETICTTPECFSTASYYMNNMNFRVKPCDNFFEHACGRWIHETKIPKSKGKYLIYTVLRDRVNSELGDLLSKPIKPSEGTGAAKAKIIYKSCMNTALINKLGDRPLLRLLHGELAWPIIHSNWDESKFDLVKTLSTLRGKFHNNVLFKVKVGRETKTHELQIANGKMAIPFKRYTNPHLAYKLNAYYKLFYETAINLGADKRTAERDVEKVREFELKLLKLKENNNAEYGYTRTLAEMNQILPGIDWVELFTKMIRTYPVTPQTKILVFDENYLKKLISLIQQTDKRIVQNYMVWRLVKHRVRNLSARFENLYREYVREVYHRSSLPTRKYKCSHFMMFSLKRPTGYLFIKKYFSKAKKDAAKVLFEHVKKGFVELLNTEVNWMDNKTREYAKKKALAVKFHIGYNEQMYNNVTKIDASLQQLHPVVGDYFGNVVKVLTEIAQNKFKLLGKPVKANTDPFTARPTMVNARYDPTYNTVSLPGGELQYPFYWGNKYLRAYQYGAIGSILGHELTHGFDDNGRMYDIQGRMRNWWSPASLAEFKKREKCMEKQYSSIYWPLAGKHLDGVKLLGENIADNGGVREAYVGYQIWLKDNGLKGEALEPSTGLTNNQMFFIGYANVRCGKFTRAGAISQLATDNHGPGKYRITTALQNFDKFSEAFSCPSGSFMNPRHKCVIW